LESLEAKNEQEIDFQQGRHEKQCALYNEITAETEKADSELFQVEEYAVYSGSVGGLNITADTFARINKC